MEVSSVFRPSMFRLMALYLRLGEFFRANGEFGDNRDTLFLSLRKLSPGGGK